MRRRYNTHLITQKRVYSLSDIAKLFKLHIRTVQSWCKQGMQPIDALSRPILVRGDSIKRFLDNQKQRQKVKLKDDEFFCLSCRKARMAIPGSISYENSNRKIGDDALHIIIYGKCPACKTKLSRFSSDKSAGYIKYQEKGRKRTLSKCLKTDIDEYSKIKDKESKNENK